MKTALLGLSMIISFSSFASEDVYELLNVEEKRIPAPKTELVHEKSVGGITCTKTSHLVNGDAYACILDFESLKSSEIYESLNVEATALPAPRTQTKYQKIAGDLLCVKTNDIVSGDSYSCKAALL